MNCSYHFTEFVKLNRSMCTEISETDLNVNRKLEGVKDIHGAADQNQNTTWLTAHLGLEELVPLVLHVSLLYYPPSILKTSTAPCCCQPGAPPSSVFSSATV